MATAWDLPTRPSIASRPSLFLGLGLHCGKIGHVRLHGLTAWIGNVLRLGLTAWTGNVLMWELTAWIRHIRVHGLTAWTGNVVLMGLTAWIWNVLPWRLAGWQLRAATAAAGCTSGGHARSTCCNP